MPGIIEMEKIRQGVIGSLEEFRSPFGQRRVVFADWLASARGYLPMEDYIRAQVLPYYANTHTFTSFTGTQTNQFREEARQVIQEAVNANPKLDIVLFTGSGVTGAINKLIDILDIRKISYVNQQNYISSEDLASTCPPPVLVIVSPYEHHSNLIPWREAGCEVIMLSENGSGTISIDDLQSIVFNDADYQISKRKKIIGSFSAASNVTGIITPPDDVYKITEILHSVSGLCFWDYASAAPYLEINMNPYFSTGTGAYKDAIFISPHKFLGGINTPGILILKKHLLNLENAPSCTGLGGGTVFFVTDYDHRFLSNKILREEGGTQDIMGAIRAGLAFQLKKNVTTNAIEEQERRIWKRVLHRIRLLNNLEVLGLNLSSDVDKCLDRLAVLSFLIRSTTNTERFLHYHFVSALLNDLFGIQSRGGCMCAGPYSQHLLGISKEDVTKIEGILVENSKEMELLRPGFSRLSFMYFSSDQEVDFILDSIEFICRHGEKFLQFYRCNPQTGEWKHRDIIAKSLQRSWLKDARLGMEREFSSSKAQFNDSASYYEATLGLANDFLLNQATFDLAKKEQQSDLSHIFEDMSYLRWFIVPGERECIPTKDATTSNAVIDPRRYLRKLQSTAANPKTYPITNGKRAQALSSLAKPSKFSLRTPVKIRNEISHQQKIREERLVEVLESDANVSKSDENDDVMCKDNICFRIRGDEVEIAQKLLTFDKPSNSNASIPEAKGESPVDFSSEILHFPVDSALKEDVQFVRIPSRIARNVRKAIKEWDMIENGDSLLLGLSGGKDSMALLHVLRNIQKVAPVKFSISCCTIDPLTESFNPSPLIPYMQRLGIEYFYVKSPIFSNALNGSLQNNSICSYCARFKRGLLYSVCKKYNFNKLVLAQHLDDCVESTLMSMFHNGKIATMKSKYRETTFEEIEIVRPLCYTREVDLKHFSYSSDLPVIPDNCPACFEQPKERRRMKKLLAREESYNSEIFNSLRRALTPLMDHETLKILENVTERIRLKSDGVQKRRNREIDQEGS